MRRLALTSAVVAALAAAGCGSSGSSGTTATSTPAATPPASTAPATAKGGVVKVDMKNIQFNPKTITVKKGTTVEWVNEDSVNHDVTKETGPGAKFASGTGDIGSGGTYKHTFDTAGTIKYECTVHPGMVGEIVVK